MGGLRLWELVVRYALRALKGAHQKYVVIKKKTLPQRIEFPPLHLQHGGKQKLSLQKSPVCKRQDLAKRSSPSIDVGAKIH